MDTRDPAQVACLHAVWQLAYAQEAALLQSRHFPPLDRTLDSLRHSAEFFLGAWRGVTLLGALALGPDDEGGQIQVTALVVHPQHQRRGVGRALLQAALLRGPGMAFSVATAALNAPALALYQGLGFVVYRHGTIGPDALALVKLRRPATAPP
jgi:ribosomal protein S18 acetylase RimI-like enzyme